MRDRGAKVAKFVHDRYCMRCCAGDDVARCLKCIYNANNLFFSLPGECFWNLFIPDEEKSKEFGVDMLGRANE